MTRLLLLAWILTMAACGGAAVGDSCNQTGFLCQDKGIALECKSGKWAALPCRGSSGCERSGDTVKCDMSGNQAGDACASTAEGKGLCAPGNKATLECRSGQLVETNTCQSCTVQNNQVLCQQ